jgi:Amidase
VTVFLARPGRVGEGISLAVKDLFDTAGLRTTYGSILFADHVPDRTAESVARLEAAGYVNVGKTNLHEFACGITSYNPHFGEVPNPLAPDRTVGGKCGLRGGARCRPGRRGARLGLGWLDPDPGRLLRRRRLQAEPRAGAARGLPPARAQLRPRGADGARR